jgi:hypothetical protein
MNDPATWVTSNPDKGYELKKRADGNYDFYSKENPSKTICFGKTKALVSSIFIDESGKEII